MNFKNVRVAFHNLGCKVNYYESQAMINQLEERGAVIIPWEEEADIYIINTCSVTNMADRKSRQMIHRARGRNSSALLIAAGCYVQEKSEDLKNDDTVDIIIGNNKKKDIIPIIEKYLEDHDSDILRRSEGEEVYDGVIDINKNSGGYEYLYAGNLSDRSRAFIKVQDGCNQFCTYCIIPYLRGRIRSRKLPHVIDEVKELSSNGYKEIVLTGIHLSSYGLDFDNENYEKAMESDYPYKYLLSLIKEVSKIDGIKRIRLGSLEPRIISEDFIKALTQIKEFCPHFHLSLQSGCNKTLKDMNRKYTIEDYKESVKIIRKYYKDAAITTDVIVGFPGESDEDFEASYEFIDSIDFYETHVFRYSRRKGTKADKMKNQIKNSVKEERSARLIKLDSKKSEDFMKRFIGKKDSVLIEEEISMDGKRCLSGYNMEYVRFLIPISNDYDTKDEIGSIIDVNGIKTGDRYILAKKFDLL